MAQINATQFIEAMKATFEAVSSQRGWYQELGLTKTGAGAVKNRFKKGILSMDKMAELLDAKGILVQIDVEE